MANIAGLCLGFGAIVLELKRADEMDSPAPSPSDLEPLLDREVVPPARYPDVWATKFNQRPLFTPGRRSSSGSGFSEVTSLPGLPRLGGIIITLNDKKALFVNQNGQSFFRTEGTQIGDITVRQITSTHVILTCPDGTFILRPSIVDSEKASSSVGDGKYTELRGTIYPRIPDPSRKSNAPDGR